MICITCGDRIYTSRQSFQQHTEAGITNSWHLLPNHSPWRNLEPTKEAPVNETPSPVETTPEPAPQPTEPEQPDTDTDDDNDDSED